jgi:predicted ABC-type exoprotein transport system permease subunit
VDIDTFYALFSATCFTLTGLWWNVVHGRPDWGRDPTMRRAIGGVYLSFFLPALMGLFAQVGGTESPGIWRASFVVIALIGAASTIVLLARARGDRTTWTVAATQAVAGIAYAAIAVLGVAPELVGGLGLPPIQVAALLLIILIALAHALVWRFLVESTDRTHTDS